MNNRKKTLTLISLAAVLATASAVLFADPAPKEQTGGKFYAVYLVSVLDLKPGSKAFVDPVFFTDGNQIKPFFDYCRAYGKEAGVSITDLKPGQIGDAIEPIHQYCDNHSLTLQGKDYHTLNNTGVAVSLGSIDFTPGVKYGERDGHQVIPSSRPFPGITKLENVVGTPPAIQLDADSKNRPRYFFLMSTNKALLEQIVPVQRYSAAEMEALIKRARAYAEEVKGRKRSRLSLLIDGQVKTDVYEKKRPPTFTATTKPLLLDALFADLDGDNIPDAIVGATAEWGPNYRFRWVAELTLLSKAGNAFTAWHEGEGSYEGQLAHGYAYGPRALLRVGPCLYLLGGGSVGAGYGLENKPQPTRSCIPPTIGRESNLFGDVP